MHLRSPLHPVADSLMASSALSVALAVAFVVFTIGTAILRLDQGALAPPRLFPDLSSWPSILQTFTTLPVMANAFICHYNGTPQPGNCCLNASHSLCCRCSCSRRHC